MAKFDDLPTELRIKIIQKLNLKEQSKFFKLLKCEMPKSYYKKLFDEVLYELSMQDCLDCGRFIPFPVWENGYWDNRCNKGYLSDIDDINEYNEIMDRLANTNIFLRAYDKN